MGEKVQHKTERRLVLLGLRSPDEVAAAYDGLTERAGDALEAILVEEMVAGAREFMVGMKRDTAFGPVVAFGVGGVFTEALADVALALAPVGEHEAADLPGLIRARRLLGRFRGLPAVDQRRLAQVIQAVGRIAVDHPQIAEIDLNPLIISGDRPVAADALVVLSSAPAAPAPAERPVADLRAVCAPRSVAIVGASDDVGKWGGSALRNILDGGFEGAIYPSAPTAAPSSACPCTRASPTCPKPPTWPCWRSAHGRPPAWSSSADGPACGPPWPSPPASLRPATRAARPSSSWPRRPPPPASP